MTEEKRTRYPHGRRKADQRLPWEPKNRWLNALWQARNRLWTALLTLFVVVALLLVYNEQTERTDGFCTIVEGDHQDDVTALSTNYSYLERITPEDYDDPTFKFVKGQLPVTELDAYTDRAPSYCDEKSPSFLWGLIGGDEVGLDEPDPRLPERPKGITERLDLPPPPPKPALNPAD